MPSFTVRVGRWPLAFSLAALVAVGACADEPVGPNPASTLPRQASLQSVGPGEVTVTNKSGGTEVGSLRWAASQLAADGGTIRFDPSLAGDTITLGAELYLEAVMVIDGPADKGITLSGADQHRVILANEGLVLKNVTVTKGNADYASGIYSGGLLHMEHSTVRDNRGPGAAVFVDARTWITVVNSTISRNVVGTSGLRYANGATVQLHNSTIAYNAPGAGLSMGTNASETPTRVFLNNSILSSNGSPLLNCATTYGFQYEGTNISSDWSCGEVGIVVADPLLLPLAKNGGPTMTHALSHLSPAFNKGVSCTEEFDQRYVRRDAKCDVGAFEFNDFTRITITIDPSPKLNTSTGWAQLTGTVKCTRNDTFSLALELHQDQKVGREIVDIHSARTIPVSCTTTARAWSATMVLTEGAFQSGPARASAFTLNTPEWAAPASVNAAVKIRK